MSQNSDILKKSRSRRYSSVFTLLTVRVVHVGRLVAILFDMNVQLVETVATQTHRQQHGTTTCSLL